MVNKPREGAPEINTAKEREGRRRWSPHISKHGITTPGWQIVTALISRAGKTNVNVVEPYLPGGAGAGRRGKGGGVKPLPQGRDASVLLQ